MSKQATKLGWVIGTLVALLSVAHAEAPGWSRGQQELPITWEECVKRANGALAAESYRIDQPSPFAVGVKGNHTALIMCNPSPNQKTWVNIVVASNGEGGGVERQRLQARMEGQTPAQPPGPPQPPPPPTTGTGREGCQGASWSVSAPTTVKPKEPFTISFSSKGRMRDKEWISIFKLPNPADRYYYWAYVIDPKLMTTCSWPSASLYEPGQYGIAYMPESGTQPLAVVYITVTEGAASRIEPPVTQPTPPAPPPQAKQPTYLGCFKDSNNPFDLDGHLERSRQNTPQRCIQVCAAKGFAYAGVQYGESCLCGNRYGTQGQANNCNMACTGDSRTVCGGGNANSVYSTGR